MPFVGRAPTRSEVEKLRLVLSTYQDGTGMLQLRDGRTLPGWRDFERAVALAFNGKAQESKAIFDVLLPNTDKLGLKYGISCKMRSELNRIARDGRVTLELSNSAGKFWSCLALKGIDQSNYRSKPLEVGTYLIELIEQWHMAVGIDAGGIVDLDRSYYLTLSSNKAGWYQLHQFPLSLPSPERLTWSFPPAGKKGTEIPARRLVGNDGMGTIFEWYGESGGQLKYYPFSDMANWQSSPFQLELLPDIEYGILAKASAYFPRQWADACKESG